MSPTSEGEVNGTVGDPARHCSCEKHIFDRSDGAEVAQTVQNRVRCLWSTSEMLLRAVVG